MSPAYARIARRSLIVAAALASTLVVTGSVAGTDQGLAPERQREILRQALNAFDQAVAVAREDPGRARELYRQSAAAFETLSAHGIRNAALHYNLGNAYFRLGKLGRAILNYRRAQRLDPTDANLAMNLTYARNRVEPYIEPSGQQKLLSRLTFWVSRTSIATRFWLASITSVGGWLGLALWLRWRSRALLVLACLGIVVALANAGSIAWQLHAEAYRPPGVVVGSPRVLRFGAGEGYDPALTQPLGPGVELRVIDRRGEWVQVRLGDGKTGWLPSNAVEQI
jgi:tetratricopeptide (TPR) repeat protein